MATSTVNRTLWPRFCVSCLRAFVSLKFVWISLAGILLVTAGMELLMGRSLLGPDGNFGLWEGNIWSRECSQRVADPYSFSHLSHGLVFYALLWLVAGRLPIRYRFILALALEAAWEILENSPVIIQRYRETTIALGYDGDSVLNSLSDILMMAAGFLFAAWARPWMSLALFLGMEVACAWWIRDNLILNILMLIYPLDALKAWQSAGRPL